MTEPDLNHDELKHRLEEAEDVISILRDGQVDAIIGRDSVVLLRLAEAEKQLRRSQTRLTIALDASGGGVYERTVPPRAAMSHSARWSEIIGYRPEEIPANEQFPSWFFEKVHPDDRMGVDRAYREFIAGTTEQYSVEFRLRHKQDHWVWVRDVSRATERDEEGRVNHLVGVMYDITAYKRTEEELRESRAAALNVMEDALQAQRQIEEAEEKVRSLNETLEQRITERTALAERRARDLRRLAAELSEAEHRERKRLAALLHDDLQQLLLAVKLRLPALLEGDEDQLDQHVERLDELVGECLRTSRNLSHELSPSILQQGNLFEVIQWIGDWFDEKHKLKVDVAAQEEIPGVPEHIRVFVFQAVRELLFNVVKHSGSMEARVGTALHDGVLTVQVDDQGRDFDPETVEIRLQNPEGFGLFNIRERTEALGGRLEIQATSQGGARFRLQLPLAESVTAPSPRPNVSRSQLADNHAAEPIAPNETVRLLVVDDHAVVRESIVGLLDRQPGFVVVGQAGNGKEAVAQAKALRPTAVIMDVDMPNMNGVDATRRIKEHHPEIVIVGLSLHDDEAFVRAMTEAGAGVCLCKHVPADELVEVVRGACTTRT